MADTWTLRTRPSINREKNAMTGAELYAYILRTLKRTDKSTEVYEAINDILNDMQERLDYDDFKNEAYTTGFTAAEDYELDLPDDFLKLIGNAILIEDDRSRDLIKISKEKYDRLYPNPTQDGLTGRPIHYCIYAGKLYFGPAVDDTGYKIQINYAKDYLYSPVTSATINVAFTRFNRRSIKYGVLGIVFADLGNDNEASKYISLYEAEMKKLQDKEDRNKHTPVLTAYNDL